MAESKVLKSPTSARPPGEVAGRNTDVFPFSATLRAYFDSILHRWLVNVPGICSQSVKTAIQSGRRLRPLLLLSLLDEGTTRSSAASQYLTDCDRQALAIELLHCSSILVDDLVDGQPKHRGLTTFPGAHDPGTTVLTSHY